MTFDKNVLTFIGCDSDYAESNIVLFGAPVDATTSYRPGTRFAAHAIRSESNGYEEYSPYQDKRLSDIGVCDAGDLDLPMGDIEGDLEIIEEATAQILSDDKVPVMIGGEHLVTLGAVRACAEKYPDLHVLHFDAHTDLRDSYSGRKLSHATVIRRVCDLIGGEKIYQLGIRSGEKEEFEFAEKHTNMCKFDCSKIDEYINALKGKPVYVTIDLDVLDPAFFAGTGTPEPDGIDFKTLLSCVLKMKDINIVGADINELSPHYDQSGASTAVACKILRELLLVL